MEEFALWQKIALGLLVVACLGATFFYIRSMVRWFDELTKSIDEKEQD